MSFCKVASCRFKFTHVTKGHRCGKCWIDGHGEIECHSRKAKLELEFYYDDILPNNKICTVPDCTTKDLHTVDAHHCPNCKKRDAHTVDNCPKNGIKNSERLLYNIKCPVCRTDNPTVSTKKITGLTDKCCICIDNNVEILLPICYHCCMCLACLEKIT
jgi:hypothetical protein